jgi:hypothetical protein
MRAAIAKESGSCRLVPGCPLCFVHLRGRADRQMNSLEATSKRLLRIIRDIRQKWGNASHPSGILPSRS